MAEWLGTGLQNLILQFDPAWHLKIKPQQISAEAFSFFPGLSSAHVQIFDFLSRN